jgi:hypothetical protein
MLSSRALTRSAIVVAATLAVASGRERQQPAANEQLPPGNDHPAELLGSALAFVEPKLAAEFDLRDSLERRLVIRREGDPDGVPYVGGTVLSIVLLRPGEKPGITTTREKKFDDRWVLRFTRIVSPDIKSPTAVVSASFLSAGVPACLERFLWADRESVWHEWRRTAK